MDDDFLDVLLDATTDTRIKVVTTDEAHAIMVLLGALEDAARTPDIRVAAREMRSRLGSRLGSPAEAPRAPAAAEVRGSGARWR
ncbi:hypothetical protein ACIPW5_29865 [Streptomyces sp. NPDC090077]|uniref:hypothetical protein n=1 Tax=Streptomyces sp. NPDC090077 TaxID=3365938 RepID=UPI00382B005D